MAKAVNETLRYVKTSVVLTLMVIGMALVLAFSWWTSPWSTGDWLSILAFVTLCVLGSVELVTYPVLNAVLHRQGRVSSLSFAYGDREEREEKQRVGNRRKIYVSLLATVVLFWLAWEWRTSLVLLPLVLIRIFEGGPAFLEKRLMSDGGSLHIFSQKSRIFHRLASFSDYGDKIRIETVNGEEAFVSAQGREEAVNFLLSQGVVKKT